MPDSLSFRSNISEFKYSLQNKSGYDPGKSHNCFVPQFPYLKKQWPPPKAGGKQTKPVTYMGTDEPSLTPQKEAPEILNSLMVPRGMLSFDEVSEILGSLCNWGEGVMLEGEGSHLIPPPCLPAYLTEYIWLPN